MAPTPHPAGQRAAAAPDGLGAAAPFTRRGFLSAVAAGAGAGVLSSCVGGGGMGSGMGGDDRMDQGADGGGNVVTGVGAELVQPEVLRSTAGALAIDLVAAPAQVEIGDRTANVLAYNGSLPGPTLRMQPGETLRVTLRNNLSTPTNLHTHGLFVSPQGNSDNPFISIDPSAVQEYEIALPDDHPAGTFWYHPHRHGHVADQLFGGLYGAIVVDNDNAPDVAVDRVLVISDIGLTDGGDVVRPSPPERMMGREGNILLLNGQVQPTIPTTAGTRELWRVINACASRYLRLSLNEQPVVLWQRDLPNDDLPREVQDVVLAPGNRAELIVDVDPAMSTVTAHPVERGSMPGPMGDGALGGGNPIELASITVQTGSGDAPPELPAQQSREDLRQASVARRRTFEFAMGMGMGGMGGPGSRRDAGRAGDMGSMMSFTINGEEFDAQETNVTVDGGTVEQWVLTNSSPMDHPMHQHVWPMQIVDDGVDGSRNGQWLDVVNIPARGKVVVRVAFERFTGRTVYHCHILDHEDLGMMGAIEAV